MTLIFSVYVLVALLIQATVRFSPETAKVLDWIDFLVCAIFLTDFFCAVSSRTIKSAVHEVGLDRFRLQHPNDKRFPRWSSSADDSRVPDSSRVSINEESSYLFFSVPKIYVIHRGRSQFALRDGI